MSFVLPFLLFFFLGISGFKIQEKGHFLCFVARSFLVAVVQVCCFDCLLCMLLLKWGVDQEHRIEYITIENSLILNIGPAWKCMEQSCSNHFAGS